MRSETLEWGWVDQQGKPQEETFVSADDAIKDMRERYSLKDMTVEDIARYGHRLARVRVTFETVTILSPPPPPKAGEG